MKTTTPLSPYPSITTHIFVASGTSDKIGTIHRRLAWPMCKDDIYKSRTTHISTSYFTHSRLSATHTSSNVVVHDVNPDMFHAPVGKKLDKLEENIEKVIYGCRFVAILAVWGSLLGSLLCFVKGCTYITAAFQEYMVNRAKVIMYLVEAIDIYLLGTVMLVFGIGLYELFISNLDKSKLELDGTIVEKSSLFGLFPMKERPRWLEIKTVNELKTKLGHVIVMLLLIGLFEKSKIAIIQTPTDLLCFSLSILLCSGCLYLLSKLNH